MPTLEREGATVAYEVRGPSDGDALVLAHNLMTGRAIFDDVASRLAPRWRTIAVDLRGHGESGGARAPFTTKDLAADLVALLDALAIEQATLVGVSLGAVACMEAALAHPSRVKKLVVMGSTARASTRGDAAASALLGVVTRAVGVRPFVARKASSVLFAPAFRTERPAALAAWEARVASMQGRDVAWASRAWSTRPALRERLRALRLPTLALVGDLDVPCPRAHSEEIVAAIPGARLEVVARAGHTLPLERPAEVTALLEAFLA